MSFSICCEISTTWRLLLKSGSISTRRCRKISPDTRRKLLSHRSAVPVMLLMPNKSRPSWHAQGRHGYDIVFCRVGRLCRGASALRTHCGLSAGVVGSRPCDRHRGPRLDAYYWDQCSRDRGLCESMAPACCCHAGSHCRRWFVVLVGTAIPSGDSPGLAAESISAAHLPQRTIHLQIRRRERLPGTLHNVSARLCAVSRRH